MTALHTCLVGALARTGGIALVIVSLSAARSAPSGYLFRPTPPRTGSLTIAFAVSFPTRAAFSGFVQADGLSRFDGSRFVNYGPEQGLPNPAVEAFVESAPGIYWVATLGGLARLRSASSAPQDAATVVEHLRHLQDNGPVFSPPIRWAPALPNTVFKLCQDRAGRLWIGYADGLFVVEHPNGVPAFRRIDMDSDGSRRVGRSGPSPRASTGRSGWARLRDCFAGCPTAGLSPIPRSGQARRYGASSSIGRPIWIGHDGGLSVLVPSLRVSREISHHLRSTARL